MLRFMIIAALVAVSPTGELHAAKAARAAKKAAKEQFKQGATYYRLGQFEEALAAYSKAYETLPLPAFLFNIGQCHKQLKHHERAIFFFEGYLRDDPDAKDPDLVRELIDESKAEIARLAQAASEEKRREEERLRAEEKRREEERLAEERRLEEKRLDLAAAQSAAPPFYQDMHKKWWFWAAVGGVAIVTGGSILLLSGGDARVEERLVPPSGSLGTLDRRGLRP